MTTTLEDEKARLQGDYPHLSPTFSGGDGNWQCDLQTQTRMFGAYGVFSGCGPTQLEALLDARKAADTSADNAKAAADAESARAADAASLERQKDDELFSSI